jgi:hypothetical protein
VVSLDNKKAGKPDWSNNCVEVVISLVVETGSFKYSSARPKKIISGTAKV